MEVKKPVDVKLRDLKPKKDAVGGCRIPPDI